MIDLEMYYCRKLYCWFIKPLIIIKNKSTNKSAVFGHFDEVPLRFSLLLAFFIVDAVFARISLVCAQVREYLKFTIYMLRFFYILNMTQSL